MIDKNQSGSESTDDVQDENNIPESLQEHTGTVFGSFINDDQASDSSIGTGSSDEGIEPGEEEEEDEFLKPGTTTGVKDDFVDGTNEAGGLRGNSGGPIGNLSGKYDTNSSSAGGSGTMDKGAGGQNRKPDHGLVEEGPGPDA